MYASSNGSGEIARLCRLALAFSDPTSIPCESDGLTNMDFLHDFYRLKVVIFSKEKYFGNTISVSNSLNLDQARQVVKPDLSPDVCEWIIYKYYIPCAGDSRKYHPEECDYQPRRSRG